jgi:hypothetical protein
VVARRMPLARFYGCFQTLCGPSQPLLKGRLLADKRPFQNIYRPISLDFCLLRNLKRVVDFDAEIPYSAFELGMPQQ